MKYEPTQTKFAEMTTRCLVLVAGDYSVHSQAMQDTKKIVRSVKDQSPENIARLYGKSIQAIKQRQAEDLYLSPLGMNSDTFVAQQKDMADSFIDRVTTQLQQYEGELVEAIVIGSDGEDVHLYTIDSRGLAHCMDDVGFAAIGIGAWHAKSRLMQMGYTNRTLLAQALASVFAAKKAADIAPGVGEFTDLHLVMKDAYFPLWENVNTKIHELYKRAETGVAAVVVDAMKELEVFISQPKAQEQKTANEQSQGDARRHAKADESTSSAAPETARKDEDWASSTSGGSG